MTGEIQVKIEEVNGSVALSTVDRQQIQKRIKTFPEKDQKKVKYVHISTCQILIKSTFIQGIDSPLTLILRDNRFMDREKSIIAQGNGNLRMGKIKFDVNLQIGLSLQDALLDRSIIIEYRFLNDKMMKQGNHPFSVSYRINYALSNSHHSIEFRHKDRICIDELFAPFVSLQSPIIQMDEEKSKLFRLEDEGTSGSTSQKFPVQQINSVPRSFSMKLKDDIKPPALMYDETKEFEKMKEIISEINGKVNSINNKL
uniref:Movement protein n=1 Tax=Cajanus cajan TaxID=3821 RepID=A0A151UGG0_CAJCA